MRVYLSTQGLYLIGESVFPKDTIAAEIIGDNIIFFYADGKRRLEPVEISQLQREDGSYYGSLNTFIDEMGGMFEPAESQDWLPVIRAEIADALANEVTVTRIDSTSVYGSGINRGEIEDALTEAGIPFPLPKNTQFYVRDANNKLWLITYFKDIDKYATEKMPLK